MNRRIESSTAARVRAWVDAADYGAILDVRDVPGGPTRSARVALSRLACARYPSIVHIRQNIYWKHVFGEDVPVPVPAGVGYLPAALHVAGAGGGLAGYGAGSMFGWTRVRVCGSDVAVVDRAPRGFDGWITFHTRSNQLRRQLNQTEIALLEATRGYVLLGYDREYRSGHSHWCDFDTSHDEDECFWGWEDALEELVAHLDWIGAEKLNEHTLETVAAKERTGGQELRDRIADVADCIFDFKVDAE